MSRTSGKQRLAAWLCGAGLILAVAGYRGMTYLEKSSLDEQQDEAIRVVMGRHAGEVIDQLDRARAMVMPHRKPYATAGKIALIAGLGLLVFGLILWFQNTTPDQRFGWTRANDDA
jgi:hypothetical protein